MLFSEERKASPGKGLDNALPSQSEGVEFNGVMYSPPNRSLDPAVRPNNPEAGQPVYRGGRGLSMASIAKPETEKAAYQRSPQFFK